MPVFINDVKKDTKIRLNDGAEGILLDSAKGIRRMVSMPLIGGGGHDSGSMYIDEFKEVLINGEWVEVEMSDSQKKQMSAIRSIW